MISPRYWAPPSHGTEHMLYRVSALETPTDDRNILSISETWEQSLSFDFYGKII